jgi:hypothetical protein
MYKKQPKERSVAPPRRQAAVGVAARPFLCLCMFLLLFHALTFPALGANVTLGEVRSEAGSVAIPVELTAQHENGIAGLQFDFQFDEEQLVFWDATTGEAAEQADRDILFNQLSDGTIRVVVAGFDETMMQDGTVVTLHFDTVDPEASPEATYTLDKVVLSGFHGETIEEALPEEGETEKSSEPTPKGTSIEEDTEPTNETSSEVDVADAATEAEDVSAAKTDLVAPPSARGPSRSPSPKSATPYTGPIVETGNKQADRTQPSFIKQERSQVPEVTHGFDNAITKRTPNPQKMERQFSEEPRDEHDVAVPEKQNFLKVASFIGHPQPASTVALPKSVPPVLHKAVPRQTTAAKTAVAWTAVVLLLVVIIAVRRRVLG